MHALLNETVIHNAIDSGDMVQIKPYLDVTASGVAFEGEHSGKVGIVAACFSSVHQGHGPDKAVVQIRHDDGAIETFNHDVAGLALLERRARDR